MGIEQWTAAYNGPDSACDAAYALALDDSGNVYVAGACDVLFVGLFGYQGGNYATLKYNAAGVKQWVDRYDGPGDSDDFPSDLAVDSVGNVYVTGYSENIATEEPDYFTIKYDAAGDLQWVASYDGGNTFERANANAIDDAGNVYVTGFWAGDYLTIKYNSAGTEEWVARFAGQDPEGDVARDITIDKAGNVYVTGSSATIKYNAFGVQQWAARGNGNALVLDRSGNVYVSGERNNDCATIKFNSSGYQQWYTRYSGPGNDYDYPSGIAIDSGDNVYVTCTSVGADSTSDYATLKYDASGNEQWLARYEGRGGVRNLALDNNGNVYVTGWNAGIITTIKYTETGTPVVVSEPGTRPDKFNLAQNYPNPFNPSTTIEFALPKASFVTLKIYDLLGNKVATFVSEKLPADKHQRLWEANGLASGVYVYRLQAGEFEETKKLILLR